MYTYSLDVRMGAYETHSVYQLNSMNKVIQHQPSKHYWLSTFVFNHIITLKRICSKAHDNIIDVSNLRYTTSYKSH